MVLEPVEGTYQKDKTMTDICEDYDRDRDCTAIAVESTPAGRLVCARHAEAFWAARAEIDRNYPDSDCAPSWFDPSFAGERWEDDY